MGLEGKILTRLEPTIKLDEFKYKSYGEQAGENPGDNNTTRDMGTEFPLIIINNYRFRSEDIKFFEISMDKAIPEILLTLVDNRSQFNAESFPRDGDVISIRLASRPKEDYKDIRIDFDIIDVDSPNKSTLDQGDGKSKYTFSGIMKIPGIHAEQCKSYGKGTTIDHLESIATDLKIGFASNVDVSDDSMNCVTTYDPLIDTLEDLVKHSYVNEDSFQTFCIDPFYYLTYVDLNILLNAPNDFEESLAALDIDLNDIPHPDASEGTNQMGTKLILTNKSVISGTNIYIDKYSLKNKTGKNVKKNGYKRVLQFFENDSEEKLVSFDVEPLTSTVLKDIEEPLKGRRDEERYKQEIKYKYVGRRNSDPETSNTHLNYNFAGIHNQQNIQELDKMSLEVELATWNPAIYRFQKIPVVIFNQTFNQTAVDSAIKNKKQEMDFESAPSLDIEDDIAERETVNEFLSGFYVVGSISYIYKESTGNIRQKINLLRREWPTRLNNIQK